MTKGKYGFFSIFKQSQIFLWLLSVLFGMMMAVPGLFAAEEALYDAAGKRDPFVPLFVAGGAEVGDLFAVNSVDELSVEGVVYDPAQGSIVIVNGTVLKDGQEVGNVKVIRIEPKGAVFSVNGTEDFKALYEEK